MTVSFHTPVNVSASDVSVVRISNGASVPISVIYNASNNTVGITSWTKMQTGSYEIRIADTVTAVNSGQRLDGELNGTGSAAYPSGDGKPGGMLVIPFSV
jgi:hypothetical protein